MRLTALRGGVLCVGSGSAIEVGEEKLEATRYGVDVARLCEECQLAVEAR